MERKTKIKKKTFFEHTYGSPTVSIEIFIQTDNGKILSIVIENN